MFTQSAKLYTFHCQILKSPDVWKSWFVKQTENERLLLSESFTFRQNLNWFLSGNWSTVFYLKMHHWWKHTISIQNCPVKSYVKTNRMGSTKWADQKEQSFDNQYLRHNLSYKRHKLLDVANFALVLPTFRLIQQSLSRSRCWMRWLLYKSNCWKNYTLL